MNLFFIDGLPLKERLYLLLTGSFIPAQTAVKQLCVAVQQECHDTTSNNVMLNIQSVILLDMIFLVLYYILDKKEHKDQESIQSSATPDQGCQWESDNLTIRHHKRLPLGKPFPSR